MALFPVPPPEDVLGTVDRMRLEKLAASMLRRVISVDDEDARQSAMHLLTVLLVAAHFTATVDCNDDDVNDLHHLHSHVCVEHLYAAGAVISALLPGNALGAVMLLERGQWMLEQMFAPDHG